MPEAAVTSANVPLPRFRRRRWRASRATAASATEPPSTRKMSIQPSASTSKKRPPEPIVSSKCFCGLAPLTCWKVTPATRLMSRNDTEAVRGWAAAPAVSHPTQAIRPTAAEVRRTIAILTLPRQTRIPEESQKETNFAYRTSDVQDALRIGPTQPFRTQGLVPATPLGARPILFGPTRNLTVSPPTGIPDRSL